MSVYGHYGHSLDLVGPSGRWSGEGEQQSLYEEFAFTDPVGLCTTLSDPAHTSGLFFYYHCTNSRDRLGVVRYYPSLTRSLTMLS
jgi:hypothetical protein